MTKGWGGINQWQEYTYNADGQRVRRKVNGVETWQVYGMGGELLAEYGANTAALTPQKEYGYRNGALLVTASVMAAGWGPQPVIHDNPLQLNVTTIQARHITELRTAIDALRSHHSLGPYPWSTSATTNDWISANPIIEMRAALDAALGTPLPAYSEGLSLGLPIRAIHIQELRNRLLAAWNSGAGGVDIRWLLTDHLGTPRMIFDQTGSLAGVKRHDYLPFGEELFQGAGGRTPDEGYNASGILPADGARQKFTSKERDNETKLDYFGARYYSSSQGRFTSVDPENYQAMLDLTDPQSWNAYAYVNNNPLDRVDPDGRGFWDRLKNWFRYGHAVENDQLAKLEQERREWLNQHYYERDAQGNWRPFESSRLSTQDVFDKYKEVKFLYEEKQLQALTDKEILEANGLSTGTQIPLALPTGGFNTVGQGLKNLRKIPRGRLRGFSRGNTNLSGGDQAAKEMFKKLTGRDPVGNYDQAIQGSTEVVYRVSSNSGLSKIEIVDKAQKFMEKISFKP